jgi:hypothetical protein
MSVRYDVNLVDFFDYLSLDDLFELGNLINIGVGFYGSLVTVSQNNKLLNDRLHELFPLAVDVELPVLDCRVSFSNFF